MLVASATQAAWHVIVHHVLHDTPREHQSQPVSLYYVFPQQTNMWRRHLVAAQRKALVAAGEAAGITQVTPPIPSRPQTFSPSLPSHMTCLTHHYLCGKRGLAGVRTAGVRPRHVHAYLVTLICHC